MDVSPWENLMCRIHLWSRYDVDLWPQGQVCGVFDMSLYPIRNFCLLWHWHTIFDICVCHYERMCIDLWSRYDVDLWPQGQIYRVFDMAVYGPQLFVFWNSQYIWHMSITPWTMCHIHHGHCMTFTFGLNINIILSLGKIVFALCSLTQAYQIWHIGVSP